MTSIFVMKPGFVAQPKLISRSLAVQACVNGEWGMTKVEFIQLPDGCIKLQAVDEILPLESMARAILQFDSRA